ncbi:hypothetical protein Q9881_004096 [Vibrio parahaemolyticus]|uniref:hypothetical protein n=2 Tax=Vibrio diabolicus TaxID=50719 RepID=UPI00215BF38E|nr:hypothetical protein [Vibrio diabolicus]ELA7299023.1 hypothetical protein [Vibrio parahaemolyticus]MCR9305821.1 hypothetical protein [Vibrio diabolicus]
MVHNRYRELIKNSTLEDLKKYITIIEASPKTNGKTKDLSDRNKNQLEFLLKEYISEILNIDREILDSGNFNRDEIEELGNFIDDIFSLSKSIKNDLDDYIGWLHEQPRAIYFFLVMIRAICENDSNHICYPVIDFSFKETKNPSDTDTKKSINSLKIIEGIDDLFSDSKRLNPLINICPNKTPSTYNKIVNTLEFIVISSSQRERDRTYHLLQDLEKLYNTVYKKINTNKNVFQTSNSNLISWYYRSLTKEFPALGLSVTESTDKQKQTILCIFDVLCATTEPNQFTKLEAKLTERFGRKERELNQSKEEKTLTFSEADWAKLSQIAGSQSKSQIKAKLKELIDNELLSIEL